MEFAHKSVLLEETIDNLNIKPDGIYVDGTLGGAGHSEQIVRRLGEGGKLIGIDQDEDAIAAATKRLEPYKDKVTIVRDNYQNFRRILDELNIQKVDGILLDLGVSSYQLDNAELNDIIRGSIPAKARNGQGHPSKQTFQAIRIELNRELDVLRDSIDGMIASLNPGGRLCIITFHSLEDRIVKTAFRKNENPCICPPNFPVCTCGRKSRGRVITRKPIIPGERELIENSRSKSSKLRVFEAV